MKIIEITVRFQVGSKEEQDRLMECIGVKGGVEDRAPDKAVKSKEVVAYTPASDRTKAAAEALSKCKRVGVLRLEVLEVWATAYPHVDLAGEIAKAEAWAESKGVTRTPRGWSKALNSWLSKAQDKTRGTSAGAPVTAPISQPLAVEAETKAWMEAAS